MRTSFIYVKVIECKTQKAKTFKPTPNKNEIIGSRVRMRDCHSFLLNILLEYLLHFQPPLHSPTFVHNPHNQTTRQPTAKEK